ncbi:MAG: hypothetical protein DRQ55_09930 [Planctomycetota bacterium]|nr:MAG: hypothetical protein DRQ55_09930 [Planctomycetota bacterium]
MVRPPRGYDFDIDTYKQSARHQTSRLRQPDQIDPSAMPAYAGPEAPPYLQGFEGEPDNWVNIPPDPIIAAGPDHLMQAVNNVIRITTKAGSVLASVPMPTWWSPVVTVELTFDPWLHYDHHDQRWVMIATGFNYCSAPFYYLIATSHTSDPMGPWSLWALEANLDGAAYTDYWADYPKIGLDDTNFYVTSNQFSCSGSFKHAKIRVMAKSQFYANTGGSISWWDFWGLPSSIQPCLTFGLPDKEWLVRTPSFGGSAVQVYSITGTWPDASPPVLTDEGSIPVASYSAPPNAEQPGGAPDLETGDARLLGAVYRNGKVWTCQAVYGSPDSMCRYMQLDVENMTATFDRTYGATGYSYFYPAINVDPMGNMVSVFSRCSATAPEFAGARFTQKRGHEDFFQVSAPLKAGESTYDKVYDFAPYRNRWGDYGGVAIDPVNTTHAWLTHEYAKPPGTTIPPFIGDGEWGTWIGEVGQPPVNDDGFSPIIVQEGTYYGTLNGATTDGGSSCGFVGADADVWYVYTAPCSGILDLSTCGSHDMNGIDEGTDTVISVHSGLPGTVANEIICSDDNPFCDGTDVGELRDSYAPLAVTQGQFYIIRVANFGGSPAEDFQLHLDLHAAPWCDLGMALAGTNGLPMLSGSGTLDGGTLATLNLTGGLPGGSAYFVLGVGALQAPFKGGTLVPSPDVISAGLPLDGGGALEIAFAWPVGLPVGAALYWQSWIPDVGGPVGFAASNGLLSTQP